MVLEQDLQKGLFSKNQEKTYIDKLLGKQEIQRTKELISKKSLTRGEILELLHMCSSAESKLWNFSDWDRYIILKFFVWIREFVKITEILFDQKEKMKTDLALSKRSLRLLDNNEKLIQHNTKFLVELYFNMGRTTLSLGGTGFMELLKNKFEVIYPYGNVPGGQAPVSNEKKFKLWGMGGNTK